MEQEKFSRKSLLIVLLAIVAICGISLVAIVPSMRVKIRQIFHTEQKELLAKVSGSIGPDLPVITALKTKENEKISIEIYKTDSGGLQSELLDLYTFDEGRDGYFMFMNESTNLALGDYDQDGYMEILVPTFDAQMSPRLHVVKYNLATKSFELKAGE